jgi:serine/threonine-protein kinase
MGTQAPAPEPVSGGVVLPLADRYRVLARVGIGGTAVVYRCEDLHTNCVVAVKVLRTNGPLIPEAAARFRREAHLAATLSHPHIVRVLDFGYTLPLPTPTPTRTPWSEDPNQPVPYVAMEYVFGSTLKQVLKHYGPLPFSWVWKLGDQLCKALASAHASGVVHRDVKPQNVLILDSHIELLAKLTDFGIARQVGGDFTTLTATGQVLGTPDYLSPEQVLGEPGGPSSDVYALAIVLYELITGRLPFEADTPLAAASRRMVAEAPPLKMFRPDVPSALQDVLLLALHREASERFADATEFAQALRWSRERSPTFPLPLPGAWVLRPQAGTRPQPALESAPPDAPAESDAELQSTVLRVMTLLPALESANESPEPVAPHVEPGESENGLRMPPANSASDDMSWLEDE